MYTSPHMARAQWISLLAQAPLTELVDAMRGLEQLAEANWLRPPQTGLYMLRGRIGGSGAPFNLGEVSVTRCSLQLGDRIGHAWVRGSDRRHAELAALADALLQDPARHDQVSTQVLVPLQRSLQARREDQSRKAAATKVEFFTVVRGE